MKTQLIILLHVVIASVLSGLIGFEREKEDKPAGIIHQHHVSIRDSTVYAA